MNVPFRCPGTMSLPPEELEDLFLDRHHLFFRQAGVNHLTRSAGPCATEMEDFLTVLGPRFLELEALPAHQQKSDHVAKADAAGIRLPFQALETFEEKVIIDAWPTAALGRGNAARPEAECSLGRPLPDLAGEVLSEELPSFI